MKKETIIVIIGVVVLVSLLIAISASTLYPAPWGRSDTRSYSGNNVIPGMRGPGMMGSGMMGSGMMGSTGMMALYTADASPITVTDARNRAQSYADRYYPGAGIGDFMEFSLNYYAELRDASGMSIAEILVDRYTGAVTPEPGPNMAWNTGRRSAAAVVYDLAGGKSRAEQFLAGYLPGATIRESMSYPGYYTFDFGRAEVEGMLSVNAYTGDIWVHTWHGQYIGG
jgi:hypothetical protein